MPEILDAAAKVFYQKGYEASSIQEIADSVGMLKGSLYHYMNTKEDLLFGVMQEVLDDLIPQFDRWRSLKGTYLSRILMFVEEYVVHIIRNRVKVGVFFADFEALSPPRRAVIIRSKDLYDEFLRALIISGQKEGSVAADIDPKLAAMAIFGMANSTHQWYRPRGGQSPEQVAKSLAILATRSLSEARTQPI
jgi:AcrR family transcriptional regulator